MHSDQVARRQSPVSSAPSSQHGASFPCVPSPHTAPSMPSSDLATTSFCVSCRGPARTKTFGMRSVLRRPTPASLLPMFPCLCRGPSPWATAPGA